LTLVWSGQIIFIFIFKKTLDRSIVVCNQKKKKKVLCTGSDRHPRNRIGAATGSFCNDLRRWIKAIVPLEKKNMYMELFIFSLCAPTQFSASMREDLAALEHAALEQPASIGGLEAGAEPVLSLAFNLAGLVL